MNHVIVPGQNLKQLESALRDGVIIGLQETPKDVFGFLPKDQKKAPFTFSGFVYDKEAVFQLNPCTGGGILEIPD